MFGDLKLAWELWGYWRQIKEGTMNTETMMQLVTLLIPILAPLITAGVKKLLPRIPKLVVVILQPILGAIIGAFTGIDVITGAEVGMILGGSGIAVRETVDQSKKLIVAVGAGMEIPRIQPAQPTSAKV